MTASDDNFLKVAKHFPAITCYKQRFNCIYCKCQMVCDDDGLLQGGGGAVVKMTQLRSSSFHERGSGSRAPTFQKCGSGFISSFFMVGTVFENHCSISNATPASYDVTALSIIKPRKHQRLADPLLQPGVLIVGVTFSVL